MFAAGLAGPAFGQAGSRIESLSAMRDLDARVATVGHRLAVAGVDLCATTAWLPGIALHDLSQYGADFRDAAIRAFGIDAGPGVLALAEGGPAEQAGVRRDDIILDLDGTALPAGRPDEPRTFERMEALLEALEAAFADRVAVIGLRRGGGRLEVEVRGARGCASRFQLIPSRRLNALADGRYVQVTSAIGAYVGSDDELAAVLAHELAHNILRHRARLDAAGIQRGVLRQFGRNARLTRETEQEADRFAVYLLDRAGYDLGAALAFWERFGRRGLNFLGSPTHGSWRTRVALIRREVEAVRRARALGEIPAPPIAAPAGEDSGR
ncbi:MAG: M48 family metalloprotease [Sphingomonas sp.]|nr:M48 family metalloprotease [Sphingomonas sp.]